jgi:beta-xylosidase
MKTIAFTLFLTLVGLSAQEPPELETEKLSDIYMRDACGLPDKEAGIYYMVASDRGARVRAYKSRDLVNWEGPHIVYETPDEMWGEDVDIRSIWAPEIHKYKGKYYLFVTFSSTKELGEQWNEWGEDWANWPARVRRASQVLVADNPLGPYEAFSNEPTLSADMITLDGTLWEEDGQPYMIYCHEWVQIVNGTMEMISLSEDLSKTTGEPELMFRGSEAPWNRPSPDHGCHVTDGAWIHRSKSGKLFMPWSSFSATGYTVGLAVSDSGKLAGPWTQQEKPLYTDDGGHSMLFERFDGQLMMTLHTPNGGPQTRIQMFEVEDTGETLKVLGEFPKE